MEIQTADKHRATVVTLLKAEKLLTDDLPESLENFVVATDAEGVIGVAGLEVYGQYGLLRSVAVRADKRDRGIAKELIKEIEALATGKGLTELFLLTETASVYFGRKGYEQISRAEVPAEVQASSEFSYACPQSAIVMKKKLTL
jgi:amino-acid N-acetyltransferase